MALGTVTQKPFSDQPSPQLFITASHWSGSKASGLRHSSRPSLKLLSESLLLPLNHGDVYGGLWFLPQVPGLYTHAHLPGFHAGVEDQNLGSNTCTAGFYRRINLYSTNIKIFLSYFLTEKKCVLHNNFPKQNQVLGFASQMFPMSSCSGWWVPKL